MRKLFTLLFTSFLLSTSLAFSQCDPTNISVNNLTNNGALLSWTAPSSSNFQVKWRVLGSTSSWLGTDPNVMGPILIGTDTLLLDTLSSNTTYEWRIRPFGCTPSTPWWNGPNFTTLSPCNLTSSFIVTNASCSGLMNGGIDLTISNEKKKQSQRH
jgi:hypothetical protein